MLALPFSISLASRRIRVHVVADHQALPHGRFAATAEVFEAMVGVVRPAAPGDLHGHVLSGSLIRASSSAMSDVCHEEAVRQPGAVAHRRVLGDVM